MGKILFSLAFATALLALASSEASAFLYSSFVCQAVGARSVGWGRSFFIGEAKVIALSDAHVTAEFAPSAIAFRGIDYSLKPRPNACARLARSFRPRLMRNSSPAAARAP